MYKLVLIRHGESVWNKANLFTGWTDVDLSEKGVEEARAGGQALFEAGYTFDIAFTSVLRRAIRTLWMVLDEMDLMWIPVRRAWQLNERHYGALQGLNKPRLPPSTATIRCSSGGAATTSRRPRWRKTIPAGPATTAAIRIWILPMCR